MTGDVMARLLALEADNRELRSAVRALLSGHVDGNLLRLGVGVNDGPSEAAATASTSLRGVPGIVFPVGGMPESSWPRLVYQGGRFQFWSDETGFYAADVATPGPRVKFRGDGDPITVSGTVTGTAFTLIDSASVPRRFRQGSVVLGVGQLTWLCSPTLAANTATTDFYLAADGYTVTTRTPPQQAPEFIMGIPL